MGSCRRIHRRNETAQEIEPAQITKRAMIKPGAYKHNPAGWKICVKGPGKGMARNPKTGERMEMIDFIVWVYGISREEAILQILSLRAGRAERN